MVLSPCILGVFFHNDNFLQDIYPLALALLLPFLRYWAQPVADTLDPDSNPSEKYKIMRLEFEPSTISESEIMAPSHTPSAPFVDSSALVQDGIAAAQRGDRAMARTMLLQATEIDGSNVDAWLWLASISEYPEELLVFLDHVLDIDPQNRRALDWHASTRSLIAKTFVHRGIAAKDEGRNDFAMECLLKAIENDENCEMAWFWRASMTPDENESLECLDRVLAINPDNEAAHSARTTIVDGRKAAAFADVQRAIVQRDWHDAVVEIDNYLEDDMQNIDAWTLRSHISASIKEKVLCYERILEIDPGNSWAMTNREFLRSVEAAAAPAEPVHEPVVEAAETAVAEESFSPAAVVNLEPTVTHSFAPAEEPAILKASPFDQYAQDEPKAEAETFETPAVTGTASELSAEEVELSRQATDEDLSPAYHESMSYTMPSAEDEIADESEAAVFAAPEQEISDDKQIDVFVPQWSAPTASFDAEVNSVLPEIEAADHTEPEPESMVSMPEPTLATAPSSSPSSSPYDSIQYINDTAPPAETQISNAVECPFCAASLNPLAFSCRDCRAVLSLSDIDSMLNNTTCDMERIHESVTEMEAAWNQRDFSSAELKDLGVGHLNLKNYERGMSYLQEALRVDPNDVILSGQINGLAIRFEEMRRQSEQSVAMVNGRSILVVDDSATVRKLISNKLEKHGHTVVCASDGVEAMDAIEHFTPELVLLDITMPRMDGYQVCKMIRSRDTAKHVPVVMISGKDGFFDKVRGKMSGCTGYITKPFGPETLMKALDTYLINAELQQPE